MSVGGHLGLDGETSEPLALAHNKWDGWVQAQPELAAAGGMSSLRAWLSSADPARADQVLLGLATLGATDGGDDPVAAAALSWALLPGACTLANRLRTLTPRIDEVVAAQLWVEVRTFPWQRLTKVAANVLMNTRVGVLRECGAQSQVRRADPTWSSTHPVDPDSPFWRGHPDSTPPEPTPAEELLDVLDRACEQEVISRDDRRLLLCLVEAADRLPTARTGRGHGGLMANDITQDVAQQWGVSAVTVRRRTRWSIQALSSACGGRSAGISA